MYELKRVETRLVLREREGIYGTEPLSEAWKVAKLLEDNMKDLDKEELWVVNFDSRMRPVNYNVVSIGGMETAPVEIANVFKTAILSNSNRIIMAHNHPSGETTPSDFDVEITKRVAKAGNILGINLLDHIIVGNGYYSFFQNMPYTLKCY